jgi:hypothetical protein
MLRHIAKTGRSFRPPSNGSSLLSPTLSIMQKTREINITNEIRVYIDRWDNIVGKYNVG